MFALDPNVARQSAQPFWGETAPHHQAYQRGDHADDYDKLSELAHLSKVARINRRHKLETRCRYSFEIITRHSGCKKPRARTRFAALFESWRASITRTSQRTKRSPKKNLRRSTKRMKS